MVVLGLLIFFNAGAQEKKVFISRPKHLQGALVKLQVKVNGTIVTMPNNSYAILSLNADSVVIEPTGGPGWTRKEGRIVSTDSVTYIALVLYYPEPGRKDVVTVTRICQSCYEDNIKKSRKIE